MKPASGCWITKLLVLPVQGHAKMSFVDFKACLQQIARDKGREFGDLERNVITSGGPLITTACV